MSLDQEERIKLIQRMRETVATRIQSAPPIAAAQPASSLDPEAEREDFAILQRGADIYHISLNSPHKFGKPLSLARRIWRKLLKPILIRQVHYNSANARSLAVLKAQVEQLRSENQAIKSELQERFAQPLKIALERLRTNELMIRDLRDELTTQRAKFQEQLDDFKFTEKQQSRLIVKLHKQLNQKS